MTTTAHHITHLNSTEFQSLHQQLRAEFDALRCRSLKLDMTRGKPAPEQLDLSNSLLSLPGTAHHLTPSGDDARNYGGLQGLPEVRTLFASLLGAPPDQIVVATNSSLAIMHDCIVWALLKGVPGSQAPWSQSAAQAQANVNANANSTAPPTFLCPVPGYDRHFAICEEYGIRMLPVPLTGHGPDMDRVEALVSDPAQNIKGMWCVPKYSNPTGEIYSPETVQRLASMPAAAPDFRIFWDNAYAVHHLTTHHHEIVNLLELCAKANHPDRAFAFASTSKITLAGSGLAFFASSSANVRWYLARAGKQTIGPDKLNQLRHLLFLKDAAGLHRHMDAHRALLAPKYQAVIAALDQRLANTGVAQWVVPDGGYFISVDATEGTARRVVELARDAGVALTPAGATWPYGRDPHDRTLRLAPSYPSLADVRAASEVIALCILLAAVEKHAKHHQLNSAVAQR
jgi:aspartate/methionine/tyrosine aminotransferase